MPPYLLARHIEVSRRLLSSLLRSARLSRSLFSPSGPRARRCFPMLLPHLTQFKNGPTPRLHLRKPIERAPTQSPHSHNTAPTTHPPIFTTSHHQTSFTFTPKMLTSHLPLVGALVRSSPPVHSHEGKLLAVEDVDCRWPTTAGCCPHPRCLRPRLAWICCLSAALHAQQSGEGSRIQPAADPEWAE